MSKYIFLLLITFSEATIGVFVKLVGKNVPVFSLNFYRILFALFLVTIVMPFVDKNFWRLERHNIKHVLVVGALIAAQISMFNIAMTLAPIANVVIFWSVAPFFVFIFSAFFLKEKVVKEHILIFLIAFVGLFIAKPFSTGYALGNIIALIDGAVYAGLITYLRYKEKSDKANLLFWYMLMALIYLLPGIIIFGPGKIMGSIYYDSLGFSVPVLVWVACLGVVSTGIAYVFITLVLEKINAAIYSLVDIIVSPVVAGIFGYIIFYEVPSKNTAIGAVFLLFSGFVLTAYMHDPNQSFIHQFINQHLKGEPTPEEKIIDKKIIK